MIIFKALRYALELPQEPHIILRVHAQVIHLVFHLRDALDTHSEGKAGIDLRINAKVPQHIGMHHAATKYLYPSGMLA